MKRSLICRAGALLVLAALMLALALPAAAEETTIRIRSAEDFCVFAEKFVISQAQNNNIV